MSGSATPIQVARDPADRTRVGLEVGSSAVSLTPEQVVHITHLLLSELEAIEAEKANLN